MTNRVPTENLFAGVVYGTAIGDAMGYPVEFMDVGAIKARGVLDTALWNLYSDDTQMFRAVCEGLLRADTIVDIDKAGNEVAEDFIAWAHSPDNNRAPGNACMYGSHRLTDGIPWRESGKPDSKGCGTAMRSMAYGMWFWSDPELAAAWAAEHALMTHASDEAMAAAAAVAAGVACGLLGMDAMRTVDMMIHVARKYDDYVVELIAAAKSDAMTYQIKPDDFANSSPDAVLDRLRGWRGGEAVAASVYCFLLSPDDYENVVRTAVTSPGDSDSLGAIAGALVGARVGALGINRDWRNNVEKTGELEQLAYRMHQRMVIDQGAVDHGRTVVG